MGQLSVYVAGPMRGYELSNFPAFFDAETALADIGYNVFNPARNDVNNGFDPRDPNSKDFAGFSMNEALSWDLQRVLESDVIALLDGWEYSVGVAAEVATAQAAKIPVMPLANFFVDSFKDLDYDTRVHLQQKKSGLIPTNLERKLKVTEQAKDAQVIIPSGYFLTGVEHETRFTDPETGAEKGVKLSQMGALDPAALYTVSEVAGMGATKYARFNFLKGYPWMLSYDAMQRHAMKFASGEDLDPESGLPHLAHMTWHGLAMLSFYIHDLGTDDRWKKPVKEDPLEKYRYPNGDLIDLHETPPSQ